VRQFGPNQVPERTDSVTESGNWNLLSMERMEGDDEASNVRRSSRRLRKRKPDPAWYLGYVEEEETPEMIMRKFEALEAMKVETGENLTMEQQAKLFEQTSWFDPEYLDNSETILAEEDSTWTDEETDTSYSSDDMVSELFDEQVIEDAPPSHRVQGFTRSFRIWREKRRTDDNGRVRSCAFQRIQTSID